MSLYLKGRLCQVMWPTIAESQNGAQPRRIRKANDAVEAVDGAILKPHLEIELASKLGDYHSSVEGVGHLQG